LERGGEPSPETKNSLDEANSARKGARRADTEDSLRIGNIKDGLSAEVLGPLIDETLFEIRTFSMSGKQTMGIIQELLQGMWRSRRGRAIDLRRY
jgi:hypothetical protein